MYDFLKVESWGFVGGNKILPRVWLLKTLLEVNGSHEKERWMGSVWYSVVHNTKLLARFYQAHYHQCQIIAKLLPVYRNTAARPFPYSCQTVASLPSNCCHVAVELQSDCCLMAVCQCHTALWPSLPYCWTHVAPHLGFFTTTHIFCLGVIGLFSFCCQALVGLLFIHGNLVVKILFRPLYVRHCSSIRPWSGRSLLLAAVGPQLCQALIRSLSYSCLTNASLVSGCCRSAFEALWDCC